MVHATLRVGSAGWSIPAAYRPAFTHDGSHLERYARELNCVEINSSFYRPHQRKTYEKWAGATPADFSFAVKAPRQLTHIQRMHDPASVLDRFASEVSGLGDKLGVVLIQLPPTLQFDAGLAEDFFGAFRKCISAPLACEPRHPSWFGPDVDRWLKQKRIARVAADPARADTADQPGGWRGITYFRLHGRPRIYWSAYDADYLSNLALTLRREKKSAWCIFDNTAQGYAVANALEVMRTIHGSFA